MTGFTEHGICYKANISVNLQYCNGFFFYTLHFSASKFHCGNYVGDSGINFMEWIGSYELADEKADTLRNCYNLPRYIDEQKVRKVFEAITDNNTSLLSDILTTEIKAAT